MATFSKVVLSGSTDGNGIKVTQTATAGDTIHTAHASALDEVFLWAVNSGASAVKLTLEFGGTTDPDNLIEQTIDSEDGLVPVLYGNLMTNSKVLRAFAGSANVIVLYGFVNRITT